MAIRIESGTSSWTAETSKTVTYSIPYSRIPSVQVTVLENSIGIPNLYLTSVTTTSFTINTSATFTGSILYCVMSRPVF